MAIEDVRLRGGAEVVWSRVRSRRHRGQAFDLALKMGDVDSAATMARETI
jgi:hypothetical protein